MKVLIVEDEALTAAVIRSSIENNYPAEVHIATDTSSARAILSRESFDLVTVDYQLPDGTGMELLRELSQDSDPTPVIMITNQADTRVASDAFLLGAAGYVVKDERMGTMLEQSIKNLLAFRKTIRLVEIQRDVAIEAATEHDPESLLKYAIDRLADHDDVDFAIAFLPDLKERRLNPVFSVGASNAIVEAVRGIGMDSPVLTSAAEGTVTDLPDSDEAFYARLTSVDPELSLASIIPVVNDRQLSGCILLGSHTLRKAPMRTSQAVESIASILSQSFERARLLAMLKASEERYRSTYEELGLALYTYDTELRYTGVNRICRQAAGYASEEELIGRPLFGVGIINTDDVAKAREEARQLISGETDKFVGPYRFTGADGEERIVEVASVAIRDENGKTREVANVAFNVTERERHKKELQRSIDELSAYCDMTSHDLKGPLSTIMFTSRMLEERLRGAGMDEDVLQLNGLVTNVASKALEKVEGLLKLARTGQPLPGHEEVDVGSVVQEVIEGLSGVILEKGAVVRMIEPLGKLHINRVQLSTVFYNLLLNALEHGATSGARIELSRSEAAPGGCCRFVVRDNGPGVPEGMEEEIFKAFSRSLDANGTGVGLAIVDRIIKANRGTVRAYNDGGACFEFTIPLHNDDGATAHETGLSMGD